MLVEVFLIGVAPCELLVEDAEVADVLVNIDLHSEAVIINQSNI
jgi:hypothetical protein